MKRWLLAALLAVPSMSSAAPERVKIECPANLGWNIYMAQWCEMRGDVFVVSRITYARSQVIGVILDGADRGEVTGAIREAFGDRLPTGSPVIKTLDEFHPVQDATVSGRLALADDPKEVRKTLEALIAQHKFIVVEHIDRGPPSRPRL
ncbi:MAG: hypothetical protein HY078_15900 [Elusimicrobia bacterium]|nr:hypothetical protein [Elusimicrobiota bacterium]